MHRPRGSAHCCASLLRSLGRCFFEVENYDRKSNGAAMPRIRTIKPEFFCHEELFDLEKKTGLPLRIAFAGLWTICDREGRFKWRPRTIKAQVLPYDEIDFSRVLDALATRGFVVKYASDGAEYGHVPGFNRHQVVNNREAASILPKPPETPQFTGNPRVPDACGTRDPRVDHAGAGEGKGKEGEGKGKEGVLVIDHFNEWYSHYPRKVGKDAAAKAYAKAVKSFSVTTAIGAEKLLQASLPRLAELAKRESQFIPHPASWLNSGGWKDEVSAITPATKSLFGPGQSYDPNHDYDSEDF